VPGLQLLQNYLVTDIKITETGCGRFTLTQNVGWREAKLRIRCRFVRWFTSLPVCGKLAGTLCFSCNLHLFPFYESWQKAVSLMSAGPLLISFAFWET